MVVEYVVYTNRANTESPRPFTWEMVNDEHTQIKETRD